MAIGVVLKPHSTSFWLVTDHSAGEFALNSFITKEDSTIGLDNLQDFNTALHAIVAHDSFPPNLVVQIGCILSLPTNPSTPSVAN